jgi:hypothetical protein
MTLIPLKMYENVKLFRQRNIPPELLHHLNAKNNEYVPFEILFSDQHHYYTEDHVRLSEWLILAGAESGESVLIH